MEARAGRSHDGGSRGASTVIGVVLIVAITVLLAGAAATFLMGLGGTESAVAPSFADSTTYGDRFSANGHYLNVTHESGQPLSTDHVRLQVRGATAYDTGSGSRQAAELDEDLEHYVGDAMKSADEISLDRRDFVRDGGADLTGSWHLDLGDATVRLIWEEDPDHGGESAIVYECEVAAPDCAGR